MAYPSNMRPVLGVAATLDDIASEPGLRDFIFDRERDVELRDLAAIGVMQDGRWREVAAKARAVFNGHKGRVGAHAPYEGLFVDTQDSDVRAIVQRRFLDALEVLAVVNDGGRGGAHMVLHSPYTTWSWFQRGTEWDDSAGIRDRTHATLAPVVRRAEELDVVLVLENCEDMDPVERVALAASFDSAAVQVSLDTGHAHYAHGAHAAPPVDSYVRAAGAALAHVHLQDADGWGDRHWQLGQGSIDWHAVFRALAELPAMPRLMMELGRPEWHLPSARYLAAAGLAD